MGCLTWVKNGHATAPFQSVSCLKYETKLFPKELVHTKISFCSLAELVYECAEEREKPELLAESPARRKQVAQESGKTEQQVYGGKRFSR